MNAVIKPADTRRSPAQEALALLEQAWAYYTPEKQPVQREEQLELFQYANAA